MGKTFNASVDWLGMVENPDQDVNPSVNGEIAQTGIEFKAPKRDGERINPDGGESTHIMKTETIDGINWVSFPTLFQNEDGSWDNTYELMLEKDPDNWRPAMLEAKRRGELIHFGPNKEDALKYGEGSWKPKPPYAQRGVELSMCSNGEWNGESVKTGCGYRDSAHNLYGSGAMTLGDISDKSMSGSARVGLGYSTHVPYSPITGHLGLSGGTRLKGDEQSMMFNPILDATGSVGIEGEFGGNSYNWREPWKYGAGIYGRHDLVGGTGTTAGLYGNVGLLSGKVGYNPKTGAEATIGFGLPIRQKGGGDYPTQADIDNFHALNNENYLDVQRQAVGDNINELLEHNVDMYRPDVSRYEKLNPFKNCWYENTCVEAVKNGYKWAGYNSGIPDDVYDNKTFFKNYKDYGFDLIDIKDVSDIKKGDVLQYYTEATQHDFSENHWTDRRILGIDDDNPIVNFPENQFHMGIYVGNGMYWGDGSKDEPALVSDIYKHKDGSSKNKFRVFRKKKADPISKKQGGSLPEAQDGTETERQKYIQFALDTESGYDYIRAKDSAIKKLGADGKWDGKTYYKIFEDGKYYPHYVNDEKRATIGHGHNPVDRDILDEYKDGINETQALDLLDDDVDEKLRLSEIYYNQRFGDNKWNDLTESEQFMLNDYTFNVKGGFHKTFKNFAKAIHDKDFKSANKEYKRKLGERNSIFMDAYLKPWMDVQKEKVAVAPPLEDMPLPIGTHLMDMTEPELEKKETSWWRGEEGFIPDELELPWFMDGAGVNAKGSGASSAIDIPDGGAAENAAMTRTAMPQMPSLNNDLTINDNLALSNTIADLGEDTPIAKYGGQYMWGLDLRSTKAKAGKETKSDDIYANDRYSQSASKYKKMVPKYQDGGSSPKAQTGFDFSNSFDYSPEAIAERQSRSWQEKKDLGMSQLGYNPGEEKDLAMDVGAIFHPGFDFAHAVTKANEGEYLDAALYATFGVLPFSAGPLVKGTKKAFNYLKNTNPLGKNAKIAKELSETLDAATLRNTTSKVDEKIIPFEKTNSEKLHKVSGKDIKESLDNEAFVNQAKIFNSPDKLPLTRVLDSKGLTMKDGKLFSKTGDNFFDPSYTNSRNTTHWSYGHIGDPGHGSWSNKSTAIISDFETLKKSGHAMDLDPTDTYFYSIGDFEIPSNSLILTRDKKLYNKIKKESNITNIKLFENTPNDEFEAIVNSYGTKGSGKYQYQRDLFNKYVYKNWEQGIDIAQYKPASSYKTKRHQGYDYSDEFIEKYGDVNIIEGRPGFDPNRMDTRDLFGAGSSKIHSEDPTFHIESIMGDGYSKYHGLWDEIGTGRFDLGRPIGSLNKLLEMPKPMQIFEMDKFLRLYKNKPEALKIQKQLAEMNGFKSYKEFKNSVDMTNFKKYGGSLPKAQFGLGRGLKAINDQFGYSSWDEFEDSKVGEFINAKGLRKDGEYVMNTVGDYFGYEEDEGVKMALDASAIVHPGADFANAGHHYNNEEYLDAGLYAGFGILPFAAGPLVKGTKQYLINPIKDAVERVSAKRFGLWGNAGQSTTHTYNPRTKSWIENNAPKVQEKLLRNDTEYLVKQDYLTNKITKLQQGKIKIIEEIKQFKINNPGKSVPNDLSKIDNVINSQLDTYNDMLNNVPPTYTHAKPGDGPFGMVPDHSRSKYVGPTLKSGNDNIIKGLQAELKKAEEIDLMRMVGDYKWDNRNIFSKYFDTPKHPFNANPDGLKPFWLNYKDGGSLPEAQFGWNEFENSKVGKFVDAKGLRRDGENLMATVGDYFGYEEDEGKDLALDATAIVNPAADFLHAGTKFNEGKYTDAALYAGFGILPFGAGPLVKGVKNKIINPIKNAFKSAPAPRGSSLNKYGQIKTSFDDLLDDVDASYMSVGSSELPIRNGKLPIRGGELDITVSGKGSQDFMVQVNKSGGNGIIGSSNNDGMQLMTRLDVPNAYYIDMSMTNQMDAGQTMKYLEEFMPKGSTISSRTSLSLDSYKLMLNRVKRGKFSVIPNQTGSSGIDVPPMMDLNLMAKQSSAITSNSGGWVSRVDAEQMTEEANKMLKEAGVTRKAKAVRMAPDGELSWKVIIPNLTLKMEYQKGGEK